MRHRDDNKRIALLDATIAQVAEHGFSGTSVARIAKAANLSPATLYIYFADKDALLKEAFLYVSDQLIEVAVEHFLRGQDVREGMRLEWHALFRMGIAQPELFRYHETFTHSSWMTADLQARNEHEAAVLMNAFEDAKREGLIKPVAFPLLETFVYRPIYHLVQRTLQGSFIADDTHIDQAFEMAWDAVALCKKPSPKQP